MPLPPANALTAKRAAQKRLRFYIFILGHIRCGGRKACPCTSGMAKASPHTRFQPDGGTGRRVTHKIPVRIEADADVKGREGKKET
jgi:hypothetical protein